jgi:hypothetical protein
MAAQLARTSCLVIMYISWVPSFHEQRPQRHFEDQEKQNGDALVPAGVIVDLRGSHRSEIATDNADEVIG